jgi:hypothetical protein
MRLHGEREGSAKHQQAVNVARSLMQANARSWVF